MDMAIAKTIDRLAEGDSAALRNAYDPTRRCSTHRAEARLDPPDRLTIEQQRRRIMAEATGVKSLTCEFCGETFERPQGLGAHRTRCAKNPNRRTWSTKPKTGKQQIERSMSRAVEENCCIADLRRRLISALRAERDRLDRELAVLTGAKEARDR